jgi:CheY-like chemotaxis protein
MPSRNLSVGGISLLHTAFLYKGTECRVLLKKRLGGEEALTATVSWCRLVTGNIHLLGLKFSRTIFVKHFLEPSECRDLIEAAPTNPAELKGRLLLVDDQEMDRLLFGHYVKGTACEVAVASNASEAADEMMVAPVDVIFCDLNFPNKTGEKMIADFRSAGFKGYIVALTAETDPARLKGAITAGANDVLQKPYDAEKLLNQISKALKAGDGADHIYSTLADQPNATTLIEQYIQQVDRVLGDMNKGITAEDFNKVRAACQTLLGTGAGYGFPLVSAAAKDAVTSLDSSQSVSEARDELKLLESICRRLSAASPGASNRAA